MSWTATQIVWSLSAMCYLLACLNSLAEDGIDTPTLLKPGVWLIHAIMLAVTLAVIGVVLYAGIIWPILEVLGD